MQTHSSSKFDSNDTNIMDRYNLRNIRDYQYLVVALKQKKSFSKGCTVYLLNLVDKVGSIFSHSKLPTQCFRCSDHSWSHDS